MLEMRGVVKRFGSVAALKGVDLALHPGEIHALVGENGAGKSTLMKVLAGVWQPDEGVLMLDGQRLALSGVADAKRRGIVMVYQELTLVPELSVAENLFLGRLRGLVNYRQLNERATALLKEVDLALSPMAVVGNLSIGEQQLIEIAGALAQQGRILILDEPTAALSAAESERLFRLIRSLKGRGVSVVYISHRLEEIFRLADRVTVLRDGERVATEAVSEITPERVVQLMVGRSVRRFERTARKPGAALADFALGAKGLAPTRFTLHSGEIIGLAGVVGSGRSRVLRALFGLEGEASWNGHPLRTPRDAIARGMVLVPADRKTQGLVLELCVRENLALATLGRLSRLGVMRAAAEREQANRWISRLSLRPPDPEKIVRELSGGNQQKVVVGKALATEPTVLLMDEPTRGVDVGARAELYQVIAQLAEQGLGLLLSSSDTEELTGLADRIFVFRGGHIAAQLSPPFDDEEVVRHVTGAILA
jgi:ABC-type sugar transport system ATPase subunit